MAYERDDIRDIPAEEGGQTQGGHFATDMEVALKLWNSARIESGGVWVVGSGNYQDMNAANGKSYK